MDGLAWTAKGQGATFGELAEVIYGKPTGRAKLLYSACVRVAEQRSSLRLVTRENGIGSYDLDRIEEDIKRVL